LYVPWLLSFLSGSSGPLFLLVVSASDAPRYPQAPRRPSPPRLSSATAPWSASWPVPTPMPPGPPPGGAGSPQLPWGLLYCNHSKYGQIVGEKKGIPRHPTDPRAPPVSGCDHRTGPRGRGRGAAIGGTTDALLTADQWVAADGLEAGPGPRRESPWNQILSQSREELRSAQGFYFRFLHNHTQ